MRGPGDRRRDRRTVTASAERGAAGPSSARNSLKSRTLALRPRPGRPTRGHRPAGGRTPSWPSRSPPSYTIASTPARSKVSMVARANAARLGPPARRAATARRSRPGSRGMTTSQPSAASTRAVAGVDVREEHRLHAAGQHADHGPPLAAGRDPFLRRRHRRAGRGARSWPRPGRGTPGRQPAPGHQPVSPVRCSARSGPVSARSRRGYGNMAKIAARAARSGNGRCARPDRGPRAARRLSRRTVPPATTSQRPTARRSRPRRPRPPGAAVRLHRGRVLRRHRSRPAPPRSAGHTGRRTGRRSCRPCSPGSGRNARPPRRSAPRRPAPG